MMISASLQRIRRPLDCRVTARSVSLVASLMYCVCTTHLATACDTCGCRHDASVSAQLGAPLVPPVAAGMATDTSFKFGVIGDTQGLGFVQKLITDMNAHDPSLVVFPGDLVGTGSIPAWNQWDNLTDHFVGGANNRLMVPGNHDLPVGGDLQWQEKFDWLPDSQSFGGAKGIDQMDYFVDFGNTRFVSVTTDSQANGAGGPPPAQTWLENLLEDPSTQSKDHVFVYSHHPITFNNYDGTGGTSGPWWQAMSGAGVDGVFVGHWHQYQPSQPDPHHHTWEVIAGTGNAGFSGHPWQNEIGYTIVEVDGPRAVARFYGDADNDGNYDDLLDDFVIVDNAPPPTGVVGYYGFHDGTQNVDAAPQPLGKGNTGSYLGNAITVGGPINGPALRLDGNGDYAHGGGIGDYNLSILHDLTISIHASYDTLSSSPDGNTLVSYSADVAGFTDREEAVNQPYNLRIGNDRRLRFFWERGNENTKEVFVSTLPASIAANEWHEYRVTRDASNGEVTFYVDGVQLGDVLTFDPLTELPTGGGQGTLHIGINYNRDETKKLVGEFDGFVDELVIWNEATTDIFTPPDLPCGLFADLTGDCSLDSEDWTRLRDNQHTEMVGLTAAEAAALGDLDGDFRNDHRDFVLFKHAYEAANGVGSFADLLQAVPEPTTMAYFGFAVAASVASVGEV